MPPISANGSWRAQLWFAGRGFRRTRVEARGAKTLYLAEMEGVDGSMSAPLAPSGRSDPISNRNGLVKNRELLWQFTVRNVELRHKGSHLGFVWSVLNPLLMLGLYVFVFGYIFRGRFNSVRPESPMEYALGIFVGLTIFHLFAEVLAVAPTVILGNPNFVKKVVFPLEVLPAASVGASTFHGVISLCLALTGVATVGPGLTWHALWIFPIFTSLILLLLGLAWFVSAIGVFFRDVGQLTGFLSMALMFASAVFYPASNMPPSAWRILRFNPLLLAVEMSRDVVMWHRPVNLGHLAYLASVSVAVFVVGRSSFRRMAPSFADVL